MTLEQVMLAALSCGGAVLGWLARELWGAVQQLRKDLQSLEVRISSDYVRYDRLQDALRPVMDKLQRIEDQLTHKADKP
jgi:hypothetical protein